MKPISHNILIRLSDLNIIYSRSNPKRSYMDNPFDILLTEIRQLRKDLEAAGKIAPAEIIDRKELCKRLEITEPTVIRWENKGTIPCFHIGSSVRYNWVSVVAALERWK